MYMYMYVCIASLTLTALYKLISCSIYVLTQGTDTNYMYIELKARDQGLGTVEVWCLGWGRA